MPVELPTLPFVTERAFESWLAKNHASNGVWIKFAKVASRVPSITYAEALEVALCWGWIDGQARGVDDTWYLQRFTPRGTRSIWSRINRGKAEALITTGRMKAPGIAQVERARQDGRWERAYDSPRNATVPDDLAKALAKNKRAAGAFAGLNSQNRYAILHRIQTVKLAETRARRIATFVAMLARGETLHPMLKK